MVCDGELLNRYAFTRISEQEIFKTIFGPVVTLTFSPQNHSIHLSRTAPQVACMIPCSQT